MSDLIDRQLAKDAIHKKLDGSSFDGDLWHVADDIDDILDDLPSAEPRKKGYWIKKEPTIKELHGCYYECSKCHKFSLPFQKLNFCPNCGADMREGEEE